jgi:hypothetical protein
MRNVYSNRNDHSECFHKESKRNLSKEDNLYDEESENRNNNFDYKSDSFKSNVKNKKQNYKSSSPM